MAARDAVQRVSSRFANAIVIPAHYHDKVVEGVEGFEPANIANQLVEDIPMQNQQALTAGCRMNFFEFHMDTVDVASREVPRCFYRIFEEYEDLVREAVKLTLNCQRLTP